MKRDFNKGAVLLNAFLCLAVVMIHLTSSPLSALTAGTFSHIVIFIINKILCFSVPAFIFLSGYKLYSAYSDKKMDLGRFYSKRFFKIVLPYIISVLVYYFYFLRKGWIDAAALPEFIFLGTLVAHFYYIIIAVQFYLVFPLLKKIFNKFPLLLLLASLICTVLYQQFIYLKYGDRFIGTYLFYFVLGMFFAKKRCCEKGNKLFIPASIAFVISAAVHLTLAYFSMLGKFVYSYANLVNMLYVTSAIVTLFTLCSITGEKYKSVYSISKDFANSSYNIYLYHILLLFFLQYDVFPRYEMTVKAKFLISLAVEFSFIIIYNFIHNKIRTYMISKSQLSNNNSPKNNVSAPYPRICAHRGFSAVAPENTMPAFGAAVALGAEEIEFDLWSTSDGVLVSCHDSKLDRVSTGDGKIFEHTYAELLELDFGIKHGEKFAGLKIATFEEILQKFACRVIMNIHVKIWDVAFLDNKLEDIVALIRKYKCEDYCYFMSSNDEMLKKAMEYAPKIRCCVGQGKSREMLDLPNRAIAIGAHKVQLFKPYFNEETVKLAHENGIICNVFWADDPDEARKYLEMGIDTILTNDYLKVYNGVKDLLNTNEQKN